MKMIFDEMCYIVEYFIMTIFSFLIVFYCKKNKMRIIFIHNGLAVKNHMQCSIIFINCTCALTLYHVK